MSDAQHQSSSLPSATQFTLFPRLPRKIKHQIICRAAEGAVEHLDRVFFQQYEYGPLPPQVFWLNSSYSVTNSGEQPTLCDERLSGALRSIAGAAREFKGVVHGLLNHITLQYSNIDGVYRLPLRIKVLRTHEYVYLQNFLRVQCKPTIRPCFLQGFRLHFEHVQSYPIVLLDINDIYGRLTAVNHAPDPPSDEIWLASTIQDRSLMGPLVAKKSRINTIMVLVHKTDGSNGEKRPGFDLDSLRPSNLVTLASSHTTSTARDLVEKINRYRGSHLDGSARKVIEKTEEHLRELEAAGMGLHVPRRRYVAWKDVPDLKFVEDLPNESLQRAPPAPATPDRRSNIADEVS
ncbi:hypothetical protein JX266_011768 [Neoarthrinium moseri]|nr:hypothetical protein JX266_011768 [Neoarthrinium moseri]